MLQLFIGRAITESRVDFDFEDDEEIVPANGNGRFLRKIGLTFTDRN